MAEVEKTEVDTRYVNKSTTRSEYPRQWIIKTPGGVSMLIGNKEGKEHMIISHPSGSHMEYHPDGTVTNHNSADKVDYVKGGMTLSIDENNDLKVTGHNKLQVSGGSHVEVAGDAGIVVAGDVMVGGMKNMALSVNNLYLGARGNMSMNVEGNLSMDVKGTTTMMSDGNMTLATGAEMARSAGGNISDKGAQVHHNSGGSATASATIASNRVTGAPT